MVLKKWLQGAVAVGAGLGFAGVVMAHPGHSHDSWTAEFIHLLHSLGPLWLTLLALLALGLGGAATARWRDRDR